MMKSRDWFSLAVRLVGLFFFSYFLFDSFYVIAIVTGIPIDSKQPLPADEFAVAFNFVVAMVLLFGAEIFARLVYGADKLDSAT